MAHNLENFMLSQAAYIEYIEMTRDKQWKEIYILSLSNSLLNAGNYEIKDNTLKHVDIRLVKLALTSFQLVNSDPN